MAETLLIMKNLISVLSDWIDVKSCLCWSMRWCNHQMFSSANQSYCESNQYFQLLQSCICQLVKYLPTTGAAHLLWETKFSLPFYLPFVYHLFHHWKFYICSTYFNGTLGPSLPAYLNSLGQLGPLVTLYSFHPVVHLSGHLVE